MWQNNNHSVIFTKDRGYFFLGIIDDLVLFNANKDTNCYDKELCIFGFW